MSPIRSAGNWRAHAFERERLGLDVHLAKRTSNVGVDIRALKILCVKILCFKYESLEGF